MTGCYAPCDRFSALFGLRTPHGNAWGNAKATRCTETAASRERAESLPQAPFVVGGPKGPGELGRAKRKGVLTGFEGDEVDRSVVSGRSVWARHGHHIREFGAALSP